MGEMYFELSKVNGKKCIAEGLSVVKRKEYESRQLTLVCTNDGKIKEIYKEKEIKNDDGYEYDGAAYVEFDENDVCLIGNMLLEYEGGRIELSNAYIGVSLYNMALDNFDTGKVYLLLDSDFNDETVDEATIIISSCKDEITLDEDYSTFEFDNIKSYERFGVYAEAVMTAMQRMIYYK